MSNVPNISAGLLMYRIRDNQLQVMLCHAGGSHNAHRDEWGIPKGRQDEGDRNHLGTAIREFAEETGHMFRFVDELYNFRPLPAVKSGSGKLVLSFAIRRDMDISGFKSNLCEYPEGTGIMIPEVDMYKWFDISEAYQKIYKYMKPLLKELENLESERNVK